MCPKMRWPNQALIRLAALWATFLLLAWPLRALDPERRISQYVRQTLEKGQNLPPGMGSALFQDREGYLWIGSQEGLIRYDGSAFKLINHMSTPSMSPSDVRAIAQDGEGALWISAGNRLHRLHQGRIEPTESDLGFQHINTLVSDANGNIWASGDQGILVFRRDRGWRGQALVRGQSANTLLMDGSKGMLVGMEDGRILQFSGAEDQGKTFVQIPGHSVWSLGLAQDGVLWIGTQQGLFSHDQERLEKRLDLRFCWPMVLDSAGSIWVGSEAGLVRIRPGKGEKLQVDRDLQGNRPDALLLDREGSVWVGLQSRGVVRFSDAAFLLRGREEGLSGDLIRPILEDQKGRLLVGVEDGGLNILEKGIWKRLGLRDGLRSESFRNLVEDSLGRIWIGSGLGLNRLEGSRVESWSVDPTDRLAAVQALLASRNGDLWIAQNAGSLQRWRQGDPRRREIFPFNFWNQIRSLEEDETNTVWVGTMGAGLFRIQGDSASGFPLLPGRPDLRIQCLHYFPQTKELWVGTFDDGLFCIQDGKPFQFKSFNGLPDHRVFSILLDGFQHIWITSNRGVWRLNREDLLAVKSGRKSRLDPMVFTQADGLRTQEFNGANPASWRDREGMLHFASARGLVSIDEKAVDLPEAPIPLRVNEITLNGQRLFEDWVHQTLPKDLDPGVRNLELRFAALRYQGSDQFRFRYRLLGSDPTWYEADLERRLRFNRLEPGAFQLEFQIASPRGHWQESCKLWSFTVRPAFHQTWFFKIALLGLFSGALYQIHRFRTRTMRERNAELDRIVQERTRQLQSSLEFKSLFMATTTHEFRTPLNAILGLSTLLGERHLEEGTRRHYSQVLRTSAEGMLHLVNDILDAEKIEAGRLEVENLAVDLKAQAELVLGLFEEKARSKGVILRLDLDPALPPGVETDPLRLRQILTNFLGNALKFTEIGQVTLRMKILETLEERVRIRCAVEDTGPGMDEATVSRLFQPYNQEDATISRRFGGTGLGLHICRNLARLMGGEVGVQSRVGEGSIFWVDLPFRPVAPPVPEPDQETPARTFQGMALVADDNSSNRLVAQSLLRSMGVESVPAEDGLDALHKLDSIQFDLIFLDGHMPRLDGIQTVKRIRELEAEGKSWAGRKHKVIALSGLVGVRERSVFLEAGFDDCLAKPLLPEELRKILARHLMELPEEALPQVKPRPMDPEGALLVHLRSLEEALGGRDVLMEFVDDFFLDTPKRLERMAQAAAQGASERLRREAHDLKSNAGTLGFMDFSESCKAMELGAEGWPPEDLPTRTEELRQAFLELEARWTALRERYLSSVGTVS